MTTSYTSNTKLGKPASGDLLWGTTVYNPNFDAIDAVAAVGGLAVSLFEIPSASLNVKVAAGKYRQQDGTVGTYAGAASQAITTATTKVLYLDLAASGVLTVAAAYPTTAHIRLATVVAGATTITSITDDRVTSAAIGTFADAINLSFGTSTGTKIGTAVTQKIGFWNATAIVQPSGASQATVSQTQTSLTDSTGGSVSTTLAAITAGAAYAQADATAMKNAIASLAAELALVKTDMANTLVLLLAIRTALVNAGLIKGSA